MIKIYKYGEVPNSEIFARDNIASNVEGIVTDIIADVVKNGDAALYAYAKKFDKADLIRPYNQLYIDIGAKDKADAEAMGVEIGDAIVWGTQYEEFGSSRAMGHAFDDKVGCAIQAKLIEELDWSKVKGTVCFVFSVQEEVGCRGAKTAAFGISADYGLVFDVTGTGDTPSAKPMACKVGGGAAIKIKDNSVICHKDVVDCLISLAKENKIAHQCEILTYGGTDTSAIQMTGAGARVGALSIPTRYIHTSTEMLDLGDAEACVTLAIKFVEKI